MTDAARRYRFSPLYRAGLFGSVPPTMLVPLAAGVVGAWLLVRAGVPAVVSAVPLVAAAAVAFGRIAGRSVHELVLPLGGFLWRRGTKATSWRRPVALLGPDSGALPAALDGLELLDVIRSGRGRVGVVRDRQGGTVTAGFVVTGDGGFSLADPSTQDQRLDLWGLALAGFCREAGPVTRVAWHDWTSPTAVTTHLDRLATDSTDAARSYRDLVEAVAPTAVRHEVAVTVTVELRKVVGRRGGRQIDSAVDTLLDEVRLFRSRLEHAGLTVAEPLTPAELTTATRVRSDPAVQRPVSRLARTLAEAAGRAAPTFGPMAVDERWTDVRVDGAVHRTWWVAHWPRRDVPAGWLDQMLFGVSGTRTFTVVFEPIAPSRSDRDIDRDAVTRSTNTDDKARRGFRVRASDRRATREVDQREHELGAGFAELRYVGLLTVTASTIDELDTLTPTVEQAAAQAGIELSALYGRHATGWVASLPLGRTVARGVR